MCVDVAVDDRSGYCVSDEETFDISLLLRITFERLDVVKCGKLSVNVSRKCSLSNKPNISSSFPKNISAKNKVMFLSAIMEYYYIRVHCTYTVVFTQILKNTSDIST